MNIFKADGSTAAQNSGLLGLLIMLTLLIFVIYPVADESLTMKVVINTIVCLTIFSALLSVNVFKERRWSILVLGTLVFIFNIAIIFTDNPTFLIVHYISRVIFLITMVYLILKIILSSGSVTIYNIVGSITVYLLIGLIWALCFYLFFKYSNTAFIFSEKVKGSDYIMWDFTYFSFTTLTTVGYGDIVPTDPFPRSFAILEGLIGQLYPVVLIGSLVSLNLKRRGNPPNNPTQ